MGDRKKAGGNPAFFLADNYGWMKTMLLRGGYFFAVAKRVLMASQLTTFHQAAR